ncbi:MAG: RyR domain protein [Candidatus Latescibacteria bacterium ADurb.Bin168]|nr:MAG: RyR domain protein [Candidatus Latescibacteria bacterium ADurb.Bin168]
MTYRPNPIDTSSVILPRSIEKLTEALAKNTHEQWAEQRLNEGWTLGPNRDDDLKTHPCLVAYEDLPENEREYDRSTAMETIRAIVGLGYRIIPPEDAGNTSFDAIKDDQEAVDAIASFLAEARQLDMVALLSLWRSHGSKQSARRVEVYRLLAERMLSLGEPLAAYDVVSEGRALWPRDVRLRQLEALAYVRSQVTDRARDLLQDLVSEGHADAETLGLLARCYKDLWERETDPDARRALLTRSHDAYQHAYKVADSSWAGINAATTALFLGDTKHAHNLARRVADQCSKELDRKDGNIADSYWTQATLGEAALILGDVEGAAEHYRNAATIGAGRWGDLCSTRRQARLLLGCLGLDARLVEECFVFPEVIVFHDGDQTALARWDQPRNDRTEETFRRAFEAESRTRTPAIGCAVLVAPADLLFLETIQNLGGETTVVLPYNREQCLRDIAAAGGAVWAKRCETAVRKAAAVVEASTHRHKKSQLTAAYAARLLEGLAAMRAQLLDTRVRHISGYSCAGGGPEGSLPEDSELFPTEVKAFLFADAVGFGRLKDEAIPRFVEDFLGLVAEVTNACEVQPAVKNTWGDGLYLVFDTVEQAARFALDLRDSVTGKDWSSLITSGDFSMRIALHAGPAYRATDPVTGRLDYFGAHVNGAARIEPITPPGEVYASQAFSALLALEDIKDIQFTYVGVTAWAKGFGSFPTYHIRRTEH